MRLNALLTVALSFWLMVLILWMQLILDEKIPAVAPVDVRSRIRMESREEGTFIPVADQDKTGKEDNRIGPGSPACLNDAEFIDFKVPMPKELRDLSGDLDLVDFGKAAWSVSYSVLRKNELLASNKMFPCTFTVDGRRCEAIKLHDDEVKCHLLDVRAQALAMATNIVMQKHDEHHSKRKGGSSLYLLMLTKSAPWNFGRRSNARETWLALAQSNLNGKKLRFHASQPFRWKESPKTDFFWSHQFVVGFVLTRVNSSKFTQRLFQEQADYEDILLHPDADRTEKLSWKVMWELTYVTKYRAFEYLLLLNDDSFVRFDMVAQYLSARYHHDYVLYSGCLSNKSRQSLERKDQWWFLGKHVPAYSYAIGAGMFLSKYVVDRLLFQAQSAPAKQWSLADDVFIGGLCKKEGIQPDNLPFVHLLPGDRRKVELFNCDSSPENVQLTMITANVTRKMFHRMTTGLGSLKLCPGIALKPPSRGAAKRSANDRKEPKRSASDREEISDETLAENGEEEKEEKAKKVKSDLPFQRSTGGLVTLLIVEMAVTIALFFLCTNVLIRRI